MTQRSIKRVLAKTLFALAVVGTAVFGYLESNAPVNAAPVPQAAPPAMPVAVAAAIERRVTEWDEFSGHLEAIDRVDVRSRVAGYIESIHFRPGSIVTKGDTLFVIDSKPFAAELARAEATLAAAEARLALTTSELTRAERLLEGRAIAQREFEARQNAHHDAKASIQAAQATLDIARLNYGYTRITAPISGRVSRAEVTVGNLVTAGASGPPLTTIVSLSPIYATFEADEQTFLKFATNAARRASERDTNGMVIQMGLANEEGTPRRGRIEFVDNKLDPQSGTIRVRAMFENRDGLLTPGLFARLKVSGGGERTAVLISDRAVGTDQSRKFVLVVGDDNQVSYREVKLGPIVDGLRVVREGVKAGELIVVNGVQRVRPGMQVAPTRTQMDAKSGTGDSASAPASKSSSTS
jgi:membrane fusion protein, multidrug efflux system